MGRRRRNWTQDPREAGQYALTRWGHDHYRATLDRHREVTWPEFADFIRETGDPGADEVADAIEGLPGTTHDFPVWVEPIAVGSPTFVKALTQARSTLNPASKKVVSVVDEAWCEDWHAPPTGGLADARSVREFSRAGLIRGTGVELEHTKDPWIALRIAMDHLSEHADYYERLEQMETPSPNKADLLAIPRRGRIAR